MTQVKGITGQNTATSTLTSKGTTTATSTTKVTATATITTKVQHMSNIGPYTETDRSMRGPDICKKIGMQANLPQVGQGRFAKVRDSNLLN